jgi:hypothetical protein
MTQVFHGMSRFAWELVCHQGRLRRAKPEVRNGLVVRVVGKGGQCFFTSEVLVAAIYAGGRIDRRTPRQPHGRWALPGGIAQQHGVVLAAEFDADELTHTGKWWDHGECVLAQDVPTECLEVIAYVRAGHHVYDELDRADTDLPPLPPEQAAVIDRIGTDEVMVLPAISAAGVPGAAAWRSRDRWKGTRRHPVGLDEFWLPASLHTAGLEQMHHTGGGELLAPGIQQKPAAA